MEINEHLIAVAIGSILGNVLYQIFLGRDWWLAYDRSLFQLVALFAVWISVKLYN